MPGLKSAQRARGICRCCAWREPDHGRGGLSHQLVRRLKWARPLDRPQFESMGMTAAWRPLPAAPVRAAGCHAPYASQFGVLVILIQAKRLLGSLWSERRATQANARKMHDRVRYRRRDEWRCHLAGSSGMVFGLYHLDVHRRHLVHAWDAIVVEIRLLHHAVLDRDPLAQRNADAIDDAAFGLCHDIVRLHRNAAVDGAPEIVQVDLPTDAIE